MRGFDSSKFSKSVQSHFDPRNKETNILSRFSYTKTPLDVLASVVWFVGRVGGGILAHSPRVRVI